MMNGRFGASHPVPAAGDFFAGDELGDWVIASPLKRGTPVLSLSTHGRPELAASTEPWASLSGTIRQTIATLPGASYRLGYDVCALEGRAAQGAKDKSEASVGDVLIDGVVVQTVVAMPSAPCLTHELYFTAASSTTELSFVTAGRNSVALRNISLATADLSECDRWHAKLRDASGRAASPCGCEKPPNH